MKNFVIFFTEKEGTSPLVRLLDNFDQISIVHQTGGSGWEPFDRHNCGLISLPDLIRCIEQVFDKETTGFEQLNQIYMKTARTPLESINKTGAAGFKMRFTPPKHRPFNLFNKIYFKKSMFKIIKRFNVVVFIAVRQDTLRWALSLYHGDGTGKPGHIQFRLAANKIGRDQIGKISVDCGRLKKIIRRCERTYSSKQKLFKDLGRAGIPSYPLLYEDFQLNKPEYFRRILNILEIEASVEQINLAINQGAYFEKVHSEEISDFVENAPEILERFGDRFRPWPIS